MADHDRLPDAALLEVEDVRQLVRDAFSTAPTKRSCAAGLGISPQYLDDIMGGRRAPGDRVLRALGLQRSVVYVPRAPEAVS